MLRATAERYGYLSVTLRCSSPVCDCLDRLPVTVLRRWLDGASQGRAIHVWGTGRRTQDFVAAEDIGQAAVLALQKLKHPELIHVGSGIQTTMLDLARAIATLGSVGIEMTGAPDPNEDDRWDLDLTHASNALGYTPRIVLANRLGELWEQVQCAVH